MKPREARLPEKLIRERCVRKKMNHRTRKSILLFAGIPTLIWLCLFVFTPPMTDTPRARGMFQSLERRAQHLKGRAFSRDELVLEVSRLGLNLRMNQYSAHVQCPLGLLTMGPEKSNKLLSLTMWSRAATVN